MYHYIGIVEKDAESLWGIWFPDLPGAVSAGCTQDELLRNAVEAVKLWAEFGAEQGDELPTPRTIDELTQDREVGDALARGNVAVLIPLVMDTQRSVRANISMDKGLLDAIDAAAKRAGLTRSAFLASAAREKILSSV